MAFGACAQQVHSLSLQGGGPAYKPKGYHIAQVVTDHPADTTAGQWADGARKSPIIIEGGIVHAIDRMVLPMEHTAGMQPVTLHVEKIDFQVVLKAGIYNIDAALNLGFYASDKRLVSYTLTGHAETNGDPAEYAGKFVRQALQGDMEKFDGWWARNKQTVAVNAKVKVEVEIARSATDTNWIIYNANRMLTIPEFKGPEDKKAAEMAATNSGIGLAYDSRVENGQLMLMVRITPYFDMSKSWFKDAGKTPALLAHEQAHFDITAVKACELAAAIRAATLTQDNFKETIEQIQKANQLQATAEEDRYDRETNHGTIRDKQLQWQQKAKEDIKKAGCYQ